MENDVKLIDYNEDIGTGIIFRCKGAYPYEEVVDFMVCETIGESVCTLMVVSGYKAGKPRQVLPVESVPQGKRFGIKIDWIKANWSEWFYPECPIEEVWIIHGRVPEFPSH